VRGESDLALIDADQWPQLVVGGFPTLPRFYSRTILPPVNWLGGVERSVLDGK
jgi:hypothetical protein